MSRLARSAVATVLFFSGCGDPIVEPDTDLRIDAHVAEADAAVSIDAIPSDDAFSTDDAPASDDAFSTNDASTPSDDAAFDPILAIAGTCGALDTELTDELPYVIENTSTFPDGFTRSEGSRLSAGAQTILAEGTAGGSSGYSEAFAFEVLHRCEGADLVASETMITYTTPTPGAIADLLVSIDGVRVGVSVTRAVTVTGMCMRADTYAMMAASTLLSRKVDDIHEARTLVTAEHAWTKDMVFVYADTAEHARVVGLAWAALTESQRADTILYVSVSEDMDGFVYFEDRCG